MRLPPQYNPYSTRTTLIGRSARPIALAGFLGDDTSADSGEVFLDTDTPDVTTPDVSAPGIDLNALATADAQQTAPTSVQSLFADASGTPTPAQNSTQALFADASSAPAASPAPAPAATAPAPVAAPAPSPASSTRTTGLVEGHRRCPVRRRCRIRYRLSPGAQTKISPPWHNNPARPRAAPAP